MAAVGFVADGISADSFPAGATLHLLTHFHSDHLAGLKPEGAPIVCSTLTARLLIGIGRVSAARLRPLDPGQQMVLGPDGAALFSGEASVTLTSFDANHCPGAVMFLLEEHNRRVVITGDFRLDDTVRRVASRLAGADVLYLDATYRGTGLRFPPQEEAVARVVEICRAAPAGVTLGVYTIGKNRVLRAAHDALGQPFYVPRDRYRVYEILGDAPDRVTADREATPHSAYGVGYLERYFKPRGETVVVPTGWAAWRSRRRPWIHYVPYSEHCDEAELDEFLDLTRPRRVVEIR
jgi:Cft2 family RNA processing exonuclease